MAMLHAMLQFLALLSEAAFSRNSSTKKPRATESTKSHQALPATPSRAQTSPGRHVAPCAAAWCPEQLRALRVRRS